MFKHIFLVAVVSLVLSGCGDTHDFKPKSELPRESLITIGDPVFRPQNIEIPTARPVKLEKIDLDTVIEIHRDEQVHDMIKISVDRSKTHITISRVEQGYQRRHGGK